MSDPELSPEQTRVAWHAARRAAGALSRALEVDAVPLPEKPHAPKKKEDADGGDALLHLADGHLVSVRKTGKDGIEDRLGGGAGMHQLAITIGSASGAEASKKPEERQVLAVFQVEDAEADSKRPTIFSTANELLVYNKDGEHVLRFDDVSQVVAPFVVPQDGLSKKLHVHAKALRILDSLRGRFKSISSPSGDVRTRHKPLDEFAASAISSIDGWLTTGAAEADVIRVVIGAEQLGIKWVVNSESEEKPSGKRVRQFTLPTHEWFDAATYRIESEEEQTKRWGKGLVLPSTELKEASMVNGDGGAIEDQAERDAPVKMSDFIMLPDGDSQTRRPWRPQKDIFMLERARTLLLDIRYDVATKRDDEAKRLKEKSDAETAHKAAVKERQDADAHLKKMRDALSREKKQKEPEDMDARQRLREAVQRAEQDAEAASDSRDEKKKVEDGKKEVLDAATKEHDKAVEKLKEVVDSMHERITLAIGTPTETSGGSLQTVLTDIRNQFDPVLEEVEKGGESSKEGAELDVDGKPFTRHDTQAAMSGDVKELTRDDGATSLQHKLTDADGKPLNEPTSEGTLAKATRLRTIADQPALKLLTPTCTAVLRRYMHGHKLSYFHVTAKKDEEDEDKEVGVWEDVEVMQPSPLYFDDAVHFLRTEKTNALMPCILHPFNHCVRELPLRIVAKMVLRHHRLLSAKYSAIADPLVAHLPYGVSDWLLQMQLDKSHVGDDLKNSSKPLPPKASANELADYFAVLHGARRRGNGQGASAVLLTGAPACGKSVMLQQMAIHALDRRGNLVPLLIRVVDLEKAMEACKTLSANPFATCWNWVDAYYQHKFGKSSRYYLAIRQILKSRRALLLLDGVDQGCASIWTEDEKARGTWVRKPRAIERHVTEVLVPQGHLMVISMRSAAHEAEHWHDEIDMRRKLFTERRFHQYKLEPLANSPSWKLTARHEEEYLKYIEREGKGVHTPIEVSLLQRLDANAKREAVGGEPSSPSRLSRLSSAGSGIGEESSRFALGEESSKFGAIEELSTSYRDRWGLEKQSRSPDKGERSVAFAPEAAREGVPSADTPSAVAMERSDSGTSLGPAAADADIAAADAAEEAEDGEKPSESKIEQLELLTMRLKNLDFGDHSSLRLEKCTHEVMRFFERTATITKPPMLSFADEEKDLSFGQLPTELVTTTPLMLNVFFSTYYHRRLNQQPVLQKLSEVLEDAVTNMLESSLGQLESPLGSREALDGTMAAVRALLSAAFFYVHMKEDTVITEVALEKIAGLLDTKMDQKMRKRAVTAVCELVTAEKVPFFSLRQAKVPAATRITHTYTQTLRLLIPLMTTLLCAPHHVRAAAARDRSLASHLSEFPRGQCHLRRPARHREQLTAV